MLELWFDFSCPYAYLASQRVKAMSLAVDWRPMLLGGVFRGIGAGDGPMATLSPAKAKHNLEDMHRWAELFGVPFRMPAAHPMRTVRALRVLLGLPHARWGEAIHAIYAAYWQRNEDITQDAVLEGALSGLARDDVARAMAHADDDSIKNELRARTDEAISLGIFGAPAFVLRDDGSRPTLLFWGQDRIPFVEAALAGWNPEAGPPPQGPRPFRPATKPHDGATLDVYFDVASPFSYLALTQLANLGVAPRLHPILLGGLFKDIGTPDVPLMQYPEAKRRYVGLDMLRWSRWWGVPFQMASKFPQRTITAQRLCVVANQHDVGLDMALALARAMWADNGDVESEASLRAILASVGLPPEWLAEVSKPSVKQALIDETAAAKQAGVFGVPTFIVDGKHLMWGQDRLDLVARALSSRA